MFVVIVHSKFLFILNNDVNDICIVYAIPEKSTQLIEYYWDCIPVIGLRPESVHTRNGLGANSYAKVHIFFFSFGKIRLCTETICGVPFGVRLIRILMRFIINLKRISNIPVGKPVNRIINVSGDKLQYTVFKRLENGEYIYNIT